MNLYPLTSEYQALVDAMEDSDDASADEGLHEALAAISDAIETKAEYLARVVKTLDAEADALKAAADELSKKRKARENRAASIKRYLEDAMRSLGVDKIKGELFTVAIQRNPPSVAIPDEDAISDDWKIPQPPKIDRKAIIEELKSGGTVEGAELVRTESIRIR